MNNYELIRQLEVSGVKPFENVPKYDLAVIFADNVPCKECWIICKKGEMNCIDVMNEWLERDATE